MAKKLMSFKTKGMNRDLSVSAFNPEFSFENHNLRLSTNEGNTLMSWVNEKGTALLTFYPSEEWDINPNGQEENYKPLYGVPVGTAIINNQLVLFTHRTEENITNPDYIYLIKYVDRGNNNNVGIKGKKLFNGHLGFNTSHPLETLVSYESESIQKVYWVDGIHQPRLININEETSKYYEGGNPINTIFDFVRELKLQETVHVTKYNSGQGEFPAGVIQYAFTYFTKYGQETNIFYTTPLYYISHRDRGASPEDKVANSFKIEIDNLDGTFDYLRIYSIIRTSLNGTPIVKRVQDLPVSGTSITFTDTNTTGNSVDPTQLLYLGGEIVKPQTIEQKDNTLFLGNLKTEDIDSDILAKIKSGLQSISASEILERRPFTLGSSGDINWINTLSCPEGVFDFANNPAYYEGASAFKSREWYRLGVQFQHKTGKWSEPIWIGDKQWVSVTEETFGDGDVTISNTYYGPLVNYTGISPYYHSDAPFGILALPEFRYSIPVNINAANDIQTKLYNAGYRKVRPVFAQPSAQDRTVLCQGVIAPTVYREHDRISDLTYAQSSWLFRCPIDYTKYNGRLDKDTEVVEGQEVDSKQHLGAVGSDGELPTIYRSYSWTPPYDTEEWEAVPDTEPRRWMPNYRSTEIMGAFNDATKVYRVDNNFGTVHSPDIEFDSYIANLPINDKKLCHVGRTELTSTFGAIDIRTSSPTISTKGSGFASTYRTQKSIGTSALISGNYYNDQFVIAKDNNGIKYSPIFNDEFPAYYWPVFMWHRKGSLNNDVQRENASSVLLKKRISNYRYAKDIDFLSPELRYNPLQEEEPTIPILGAELFANTEAAQIIKVNGNVYQGCVDVVLEPDYYDVYAVGISKVNNVGFESNVDTTGLQNGSDHWMPAFTDLPIVKAHRDNPYDPESLPGWIAAIEYEENSVRWANPNIKDKTSTSASNVSWDTLTDDYNIGSKVAALGTFKDVVPIKYKSTSHIAVQLGTRSVWDVLQETYTDVPIEISDFTPKGKLAVVELTKDHNVDTFYGGQSADALQSAMWIPCGPANLITPQGENILEFKWGDCFFQRYECLKTYAYTPEDINQVVEIGSFMLETRVNIDGRYDRNRGQIDNTNANPTNFNLINSVYSQMDNFFNYRILPEDSHTNTEFTNQITWTKTKESGADVDLWTNITLASTLELDGTNGALNKLIRFNDQLLAFQDTGISQILYNENAQITTTEGVPIELGNSGKVTGKKYFTNTIGCSNKWSMATTPNGIYFMDSNDKSIYLFSGELVNLSDKFGFSTWCKNNIPPATVKWNPFDFGNSGSTGTSAFVSYYDRKNQDVLFINKNKALAFSEKVGNFTSFYDYGNTPYFCNLEDTGVWIKTALVGEGASAYRVPKLWGYQMGDYCKLFGVNRKYWMTLVGNPEPQTDKIFTNLEFRACIEGEGGTVNGRYVPTIPFDSLETWNEYQHGIANLEVKSGNEAMQHHLEDTNRTASLNRKFRMWRCDIPRDNYPLDNNNRDVDNEKGIARYSRKPLDRMRNPWIYLKLMKKAAEENSLPKAEIHDLVMTYYN